MGDRLATIDMGRNGEGLLWGLGPHWIPIQYNVTWAEAYLFVKSHLDPSNRLATIVGMRHTLLRVGTPLRTIFILSLAVKTFAICVHRVTARCTHRGKIK